MKKGETHLKHSKKTGNNSHRSPKPKIGEENRPEGEKEQEEEGEEQQKERRTNRRGRRMRGRVGKDGMRVNVGERERGKERRARHEDEIPSGSFRRSRLLTAGEKEIRRKAASGDYFRLPEARGKCVFDASLTSEPRKLRRKVRNRGVPQLFRNFRDSRGEFFRSGSRLRLLLS